MERQRKRWREICPKQQQKSLMAVSLQFLSSLCCHQYAVQSPASVREKSPFSSKLLQEGEGTHCLCVQTCVCPGQGLACPSPCSREPSLTWTLGMCSRSKRGPFTPNCEHLLARSWRYLSPGSPPMHDEKRNSRLLHMLLVKKRWFFF